MLTEYIRAAMQRAEYEKLEDGTYYGEIPGLQGVWGNSGSLEGCRQELQEVLEDWILLGIRLGHHLPVLDGIDLNAPSAA
jgi:predicted RNase H-like HicB family nuclease